MNKILLGDCLDLIQTIDDRSVDLVICDPPYFRIVNETWDNDWSCIEEYYKFSEKYIKLISEKIRYNGTFLLFGCSRNFDVLSRLHSIMDSNGFDFVEEIILDKGIKSVAGRISGKIKMLPPVSENIILYRKSSNDYIKNLFKSKQQICNFTNKYMNEVLGLKSNGGGNWTKYTGNTQFPLFPTEEHFVKICTVLGIDLDYKKIKQTYNGILGLTNVWNDINFYMKDRIHPTQKPIELIERLINIFSDEHDLILDPFGGSGTTAIAAKNTNRNYIVIEKEKLYYDNILKRV